VEWEPGRRKHDAGVLERDEHVAPLRECERGKRKDDVGGMDGWIAMH
jgi:hypothetical protein